MQAIYHNGVEFRIILNMINIRILHNGAVGDSDGVFRLSSRMLRFCYCAITDERTASGNVGCETYLIGGQLSVWACFI